MQKICLVLALSAALLFNFASAEAEVDEGVLVLTDSNFDSELAKHDFLLVEFYAPWCGHCKSLAPEYAKAAKRLAENSPPYYIAKVDATENKEQAEKHGVRGFPTLFFYKNGNRMEYNGGRTENEIVNWILKKVGPASTEATCETLKTKVGENKLVLAIFSDDANSKEHKLYTEVAAHGSVNEKFQFFHVNDKECAATHGATGAGSLVLFRQFDTSPLVYDGSWEVTPIVEWMLASSVPTLIEFSEDYIEPIFGQKSNAIFLFRSQEDKDSEFAKTFEEAAKQLKGQILFVVSGIHDGIQSRLAEFIGVDAASLPTIKILNPTDNMKKFQYQGSVKDLTVAAITSFATDFKNGNIIPFLKSEEIPEDNTAPVKVVVGKSFHDIVLDNDKDVLVEYYAPWCGHCKKLSPIWDQLAEDLKDVPNLTIAKMDATANEVEGVDIKGYPTLKWYPKGEKKNPVDFDGERDLDSIKAWLKDHSASYKHHLDHKSEL